MHYIDVTWDYLMFCHWSLVAFSEAKDDSQILYKNTLNFLIRSSMFKICVSNWISGFTFIKNVGSSL